MDASPIYTLLAPSHPLPQTRCYPAAKMETREEIREAPLVWNDKKDYKVAWRITHYMPQNTLEGKGRATSISFHHGQNHPPQITRKVLAACSAALG